MGRTTTIVLARTEARFRALLVDAELDVILKPEFESKRGNIGKDQLPELAPSITDDNVREINDDEHMDELYLSTVSVPKASSTFVKPRREAKASERGPQVVARIRYPETLVLHAKMLRYMYYIKFRVHEDLSHEDATQRLTHFNDLINYMTLDERGKKTYRVTMQPHFNDLIEEVKRKTIKTPLNTDDFKQFRMIVLKQMEDKASSMSNMTETNKRNFLRESSTYIVSHFGPKHETPPTVSKERKRKRWWLF